MWSVWRKLPNLVAVTQNHFDGSIHGPSFSKDLTYECLHRYLCFLRTREVHGITSGAFMRLYSNITYNNDICHPCNFGDVSREQQFKGLITTSLNPTAPYRSQSSRPLDQAKVRGLNLSAKKAKAVRRLWEAARLMVNREEAEGSQEGVVVVMAAGLQLEGVVLVEYAGLDILQYLQETCHPKTMVAWVGAEVCRMRDILRRSMCLDRSPSGVGVHVGRHAQTGRRLRHWSR